ncbi:MAG: succinate dehydrogenase assembly factor 4 [Caulobacterales bacterium]
MSEAYPKPPAAASADDLLGLEIPTHSADGRELSPAARRALAEAAARRAAAQESAEKAAAQNAQTGEKGGPKGPEPTRFGDWERKGIAVDF